MELAPNGNNYHAELKPTDTPSESSWRTGAVYQPSSKESEQDFFSQAEQNKRRNKHRNPEAECCTQKEKRPSPAYHNHGRWQRITSLRRSGTYQWIMRRQAGKETQLKRLKQMIVREKLGHFPSHCTNIGGQRN